MKSIKSFLKQLLTETRLVTYTGEIMNTIRKNTPDLKMLQLRGFASGTMGLFRYKDGNAYEIVIRPVKLSEFKDDYGDLIKKKIDRPGFKPNKEEPLLIGQVRKIIASHLGREIYDIKSIKNDKDVYKFKVIIGGYDPNVTTKQIEELETNPLFKVQIGGRSQTALGGHKQILIVTYKKL